MKIRLAVGLVAIVLSLSYLAATRPPQQLTRFDFEDGTLQGWTAVVGDLGTQPASTDNDRHGGNFNKRGKYFIGTYESKGDAATGSLQSPTFRIRSPWITLLVGGGNDPDRTYVVLVRASDGKALFRETGRNAEGMIRKYWDVSDYIGDDVYFLVVDTATGGWGHINVDDLGEMTPAEIRAREQAIRKAEADRKAWYESLMKPSNRQPYRGEHLADLSMPMGGIGAGNIVLCGDGKLRKWQIFNKVNARCVVPGQMFAIWTPSRAVVLAKEPEYGLPGVDGIEYFGEFPIAELRYSEARLPVRVELQAFSPFVPANPKDSGLPSIVYVFRVHNPGRTQTDVALMATMQNAVNYDGVGAIDGVRFAGYGGNVNEVVRARGLTKVHMTLPTLSEQAAQFGSMTLSVLDGSADARAAWTDPNGLWSLFSSGRAVAAKPKSEPSAAGTTYNGAVVSRFRLLPGETREVPFIVSWSFPNHYATYDRNLARYRLGHMYSKWFRDSQAAAQYVASNFRRLRYETTMFRDTFYDSTLPYWLVRRVSSQASTLTSQSILWLEDGTFAAFEGAGCCPMNCTHVFNYEQTIAALFPQLERIMRETDLGVQMMESGAVRHRTALPLNAPRAHGPFVDGQLGTILKAYREHLYSKDDRWLRTWWPRIKQALEFVIRDWDPNKDGVLVNEQWNTYDAAMYGPNTFIGTLYLAALRSGEEMALLTGDRQAAELYRGLYLSGSKRLDESLWNGEFYVHIHEKKNEMPAWMLEDWPQRNPDVDLPYGPGCHTDQLLGQWWSDILSLGSLLPPARVSTTLSSILKYNWRDDFAEVPQQRYFAGAGDRGLLCCTWPNGGRPPRATLYSDEVWTGLEYQIAGMLLRRGRIEDAYRIVKAIDERYDGRRRPPIERSPWNEIECGDHYARAMSSWSVLTGAQGLFYDGPRGLVRFVPNVSPERHRSFFAGAQGWGTLDQTREGRRQTNLLRVKYGSVRVTRIELRTPTTPKSCVVRHSGKVLKAILGRTPTDLALVTLEQPVSVQSGTFLSVSLEW
ncbi:MAG: hypothetical protein HRF45_05000 [Fimbriimonadia bacterium]|jgi:uncharacterized protein (DUF608 family)